MGALEPVHLIVILVIALLVFGPGKVGELGGTLGRAVKDFRDAADGKQATTPATGPGAGCANCSARIPADAKFCPGCGLAASTARDPN